MSKKAYVMNVHGEVIDEINSGDRIVRGKSIDKYVEKSKTDEEKQNWTYENFVKGYTDELIEIIPELNNNEKIFLMSVIPYISYESCALQNRNHTDMTAEKLITITKLSKTKLYATIESLRSKDIIYKGINSKNRQYFINPWLFCKGQRINKTLKAMFKNYVVRTMGRKKWGELKDG